MGVWVHAAYVLKKTIKESQMWLPIFCHTQPLPRLPSICHSKFSKLFLSMLHDMKINHLQIQHTVKAGLELLALSAWNYRLAPPCLGYMILRIEPMRYTHYEAHYQLSYCPLCIFEIRFHCEAQISLDQDDHGKCLDRSQFSHSQDECAFSQ